MANLQVMIPYHIHWIHLFWERAVIQLSSVLIMREIKGEQENTKCSKPDLLVGVS